MARRAHEPTEESRKYVRAMAGYGIPQEDIATVLDISDKTLRKHYGDILRVATIEANAKVGEAMFRQAAGAAAQYDAENNLLREEQKPVPAMTIFWGKTRMGLRETTRVVHGGGIANFDPQKLGDLSDEELAIAEKLFGKLAGATGDDPEGDPRGEGA